MFGFHGNVFSFYGIVSVIVFGFHGNVFSFYGIVSVIVFGFHGNVFSFHGMMSHCIKCTDLFNVRVTVHVTHCWLSVRPPNRSEAFLCAFTCSMHAVYLREHCMITEI